MNRMATLIIVAMLIIAFGVILQAANIANHDEHSVCKNYKYSKVQDLPAHCLSYYGGK